jgi:Kef-type K+ transport system membrane component KefB
MLALQAALFLVLVTLVGTQAAKRWGWRLDALRIRNAPFVVGMATCLGLATLSAHIGLAAIIGAFLAGMVFAETRDQFELEHRGLPVYELLVPFFFVITGSQVDWRLFLDLNLMSLALAVTALAILGKLVACGAASWGLPLRKVAVIGFGMAPRGEVGLIVASVGTSLGVIPPPIFSVVVIMSVLTTLVVPPILGLLYRGQSSESKPRSDNRQWAEPDGVLPEF